MMSPLPLYATNCIAIASFQEIRIPVLKAVRTPEPVALIGLAWIPDCRGTRGTKLKSIWFSSTIAMTVVSPQSASVRGSRLLRRRGVTRMDQEKVSSSISAMSRLFAMSTPTNLGPRISDRRVGSLRWTLPRRFRRTCSGRLALFLGVGADDNGPFCSRDKGGLPHRATPTGRVSCIVVG